jgi:copper homeostasis protein
LRKETDKDIMVMIRPRGGDFCYSDEEFEQMKSEIIMIKNFRIDGFVFGILNEDNEIDFERNQELLNFQNLFHVRFIVHLTELLMPKIHFKW